MSNKLSSTQDSDLFRVMCCIYIAPSLIARPFHLLWQQLLQHDTASCKTSSNNRWGSLQIRNRSDREQVGSEFKILFCCKLPRSASVSNPIKAIHSSTEERAHIVLQGTANSRKIKGFFFKGSIWRILKASLKQAACPALPSLALLEYVS